MTPEEIVNKWAQVLDSNTCGGSIQDTILRKICACLLEAQYEYNFYLKSKDLMTKNQQYSLILIRRIIGSLQGRYDIKYKNLNTISDRFNQVSGLETRIDTELFMFGDIEVFIIESIEDSISRHVKYALSNGTLKFEPLLYIGNIENGILKVLLSIPTADKKFTVSLNDIEARDAFRAKVNSYPLNELLIERDTPRGREVIIPTAQEIEDWNYSGLDNWDFLRSKI